MNSSNGSIKNDDPQDSDDIEEEQLDPEPMFKYYRLSNDIQKINQTETTTSMALHTKFMVLGTKSGKLYVLDYEGKITKQLTPYHSAKVNQISVDSIGDNIASCSNDGRVLIHHLTIDKNQSFQYGKRVNSVAIDPEYSKTSRFCCGGRENKLILSSKGWFGDNERVLHLGEGAIHNIQWFSGLIAWGNSVGVKVYDVENNRKVSEVNRERVNLPPIKYPCSLKFSPNPNHSTKFSVSLLIGWYNFIKVALITEKPDPIHGVAKVFQLTHSFSIDGGFISGICLLKEDLVVLTYPSNNVPSPSSSSSGASPSASLTSSSSSTSSSSGTSSVIPPSHTTPTITSLSESFSLPSFSFHIHSRKREPPPTNAPKPEVRVLTLSNDELTREPLDLNSYQTHTSLDYNLLQHPTENKIFLTSLKDLVIGELRDFHDHLQWEIAHHRYEEAYLQAKQNVDKLKNESEVNRIGEELICNLIFEQKYSSVGLIIKEICGTDQKRWEKWFCLFGNHKQLDSIIPHIPYENPQLSPIVYEIIIKHYLKTNHKQLAEIIKKWPVRLYDTDLLIKMINDEIKSYRGKFSDSTFVHLYQALAELYNNQKNYSHAIDIYFKSNQIGKAFDMIEKYRVYDLVIDRITVLINYDENRTIELLVKNSDTILVPHVVFQLRPRPKNLYVYLNRLLQKSPVLGKDYHEEQVELLATYNPKGLMEFLRSSSYYPLEKAYKVCQEHELYQEMVFILGRMGNTKDALTLLLEKIGDVKQAIEFVKLNDDGDLWDHLLSFATQDGELVSELLDNIGNHVDPIRLIKSIPKRMKVPELQPKLIKILSNYTLQAELSGGCASVLKHDSVSLFHNYVHSYRAPVRVDESSLCPNCSEPILKSDKVLVFWCNHIFHLRCHSPQASQPIKPTTQLSQSQTQTQAQTQIQSQPQPQSQTQLSLQSQSQQAVVGQQLCTICVDINKKRTLHRT